MKFVDVLKRKSLDCEGTRTPVIAFLGDSVTQGCFELWEKEGRMQGAADSGAGYPEKVKEILGFLYPLAPVCIMNAGVGGITASAGYEILKRDVLGIRPDLLVVCFGLNDSGGEAEGIPHYKESLKQIFAAARGAGIETIFMTPNMLNTDTGSVAEGENLRITAKILAERQLNGLFDAYMDAAREVCREENVRLCDCYVLWKKMYESGVDTTRLLANGLNHPVREMHYLFAVRLVHTILCE